jgi:DNA polymerase I-like protein with 3'-5' exonuclease and polymerase domains
LAEFPDRHLEGYFRIAQEQSSFAKAFLAYTRAKRNLSILLGVSQGEERIHPVFACFGTVTGRILVTDPRLQDLRKRYRGILQADEGKELRYLDFAQFEPGILAHMANDKAFRERYNTIDLYLSLSRTIFSDDSHRAVCKRIFLAYCYGMGIDTIAKLLSGPDVDLERVMRFKKAVSSFFEALPALEEYRESLTEKLEEDGFVETLMGNRRRRLSTGPLDNKERRWAVSQAIQGSASLIFKEALLRLEKCLGVNSIVLPMHDAVLMQFDERDALEAEAEAKSIMISAFKERCSTIVPKVVTAEFVPLTSG